MESLFEKESLQRNVEQMNVFTITKRICWVSKIMLKLIFGQKRNITKGKSNEWRIRNHSFSTFAKFPEKLTFLTPWYMDEQVRIRGKKY